MVIPFTTCHGIVKSLGLFSWRASLFANQSQNRRVCLQMVIPYAAALEIHAAALVALDVGAGAGDLRFDEVDELSHAFFRGFGAGLPVLGGFLACLGGGFSGSGGFSARGLRTGLSLA